MKWIRRLLVLAVVLVLLVVGAAFLLIEPAVVTVVEKGGTHALGVETRLQDAKIGVLSGEFGLAGLSIDNPPGFEAEHFLDLSVTDVKVAMGSLMTDRVEIPRVLVSGVSLVLERNANGTNYDVLLENLERLSGPEQDGEPPADGEGDGEPPAEEEAPGKKLVIQELVLRDIGAKVSLFAVNGERKTIPIDLPEITIHNLGGEDGATVDVVYSQLIEELLEAVVAAGGDQLPLEFLQDLEGELERFGKEQLQEQLDDLKQKAAETIGEQDLEKGLEELEGAADSVRDLFKKD